MLKLKTEKVELRGISNQTSKKGTVYYYVNVEKEDGTSLSFYCSDASAFPQGLKKGDKVNVVFDLTYYKNEPKLNVVTIEKVG